MPNPASVQVTNLSRSLGRLETQMRQQFNDEIKQLNEIKNIMTEMKNIIIDTKNIMKNFHRIELNINDNNIKNDDDMHKLNDEIKLLKKQKFNIYMYVFIAVTMLSAYLFYFI